MKQFLHIIILAFLAVGLASCDKDLEIDNDVDNNFNQLWSIIDQRYSLFTYKQDTIKDWNEVHDEYLFKARQCHTMEELFYVFGDMLNELKDGHVNLVSTFDCSRYDFTAGYEDNLITNVLFSSRYLGSDYRRVGGLYYKVINNRYGYIYYPSFSSTVADSYLNNILTYFAKMDGVIIDIRGNGGGQVSYVDLFASHFVGEKTLVGYWQRKTGTAHDALSSPQAIYVEPTDGVRYTSHPVVLLTNRGSYSASNAFAMYMKAIPNVTLMGDVTGGGSGLPESNELPCGWTLRYSSTTYLDVEKKCVDGGVSPDYSVSLDKQQAYLNNIDSIIETACKYIDSKK